MKVLLATAEFAPLVRVGGLAEATSGLVRALRSEGVHVEVAIPDYFYAPLAQESTLELKVPGWAGPAVARSGIAADSGRVTLIDVPGIRRPNPYIDLQGNGWPDNADRFFAFSAAVAALARVRNPDVVHCNDWHTALTLGFLDGSVPSVLTIHTLGYQGWTSGGWLDRIAHDASAFEQHGGTNPLAGGIELADRVVAVSANYADEIRRPEGGFGLDNDLVALGDRLVGIRNGIDTSLWDPATDTFTAAQFASGNLDGKQDCRSELLKVVGWSDTGAPILGIVTRLVEQKGIDIVLDSVRFAETMPFRVVLLGSGERGLADHARYLVARYPDFVSFHDGYNTKLGHQIFAGADLLAMPSRFEPCGLAQMQAMEYGTIPIVTAVGGLVDTVIDADVDRKSGTGFVAQSIDPIGFVDALHRGVRAWKHTGRRQAIQRRGMTTDWSWKTPANKHIKLYEEVISEKGSQLTVHS